MTYHTQQEPVRGVQMSDLHFSPKNLAESSRCFGHAVDRAIELGAQFAVISGDATDHALDVHAPAYIALVRAVRRLADHMPVLMLQGTFSHEPPGTLAVFGLLGGRFPVFVADRLAQVALMPGGEWLASEGWRFEALPAGARAIFSCVPTINKAAVASVVGALDAAESVGEQLAALLAGFAEIHEAAHARGVPTAVVSHGTVSGCTTEHGIPMAGLDHEFTTGSLFGARAAAVMLGHIHKHQAWDLDGRKIAYAGSIGRFHYGEEGEKGCLHWTLYPGQSEFELIPTPARRTLEYAFDGPPDIDALKALKATADGAFVKVTWTIGEEDKASVDRDAIEACFAGAAEIKLEGRIMPVVRSRADGISRVANLADKVKAWAEVVAVQPAPLIEALAALDTETPEQIAAGILGHEPEIEPVEAPAPPAESVARHRAGEELDLFA